MSYGFEVRASDGTKQLDSSSWGWQFVWSKVVSTTYRQGVIYPSNASRLYTGAAGSVVFNGLNGVPEIPASMKLYATSFRRISHGKSILWHEFTPSIEGTYRKLSWSGIYLRGDFEYTGSFNPDEVFSTTIYVFAR